MTASLQIHRFTRGSFQKNIDVLYTLESVETLPLLVVQMCFDDYTSRTALDVLTKPFHPPHLIALEGMPNTSAQIISVLNTSEHFRRLESNGIKLLLAKGMICTEDGEILMALCVKKDVIIQSSTDRNVGQALLYEGYTDYFSYDNFFMYVSTELVSKKEYSVFYRRLEKIYLSGCFIKGIEMRIISSSKIKKNTFANSFKVSFNSIEQLNQHLRNDLRNLLLTPEENFAHSAYPLMLEAPPLPVIVETEVELNETIVTYDTGGEDSNVVGYHNLYIRGDGIRSQIEEIPLTFSEDFFDSPTSSVDDTEMANAVTLLARSEERHQSLVERMIPIQDTYNMQMASANRILERQQEREQTEANRLLEAEAVLSDNSISTANIINVLADEEEPDISFAEDADEEVVLIINEESRLQSQEELERLEEDIETEDPYYEGEMLGDYEDLPF